jgi:hypothetical protein
MSKSLRDRSLDEVLADVREVASIGTQDQIKSVMAVVAKASQEVGDSVAAAAKEIGAFNNSTTELTKQLITLNRRLLWVNVLIALGTVAAAVAALTKGCGSS